MKIDKEESRRVGITVMRTPKAASEKPRKEKAAKVKEMADETVPGTEEEKTESLIRDE